MSKSRQSPRVQTTVSYPVEQCPGSDDDDSSCRPGGSLSDTSDSTYAEKEDHVASYDEESKDDSEKTGAVDSTGSDNERAETKVIS